MAPKEGFNHFLVEQAESAFPSNETSIEVCEEAKMRPHGSGPVTLLQQLGDVRLDMRTQWSGIQASNGFEFGE